MRIILLLRRLVDLILGPLMQRWLASTTGLTVAAGPFKGLTYIDDAVGSMILPKLLGTYEMELRDVWESLGKVQPEWVIDVGSAEGFYAVGLARLWPRTHVVAFEALEPGRILGQRLAELNHVSDRIDIRGRCEPQDLQAALVHPEAALLICDVEGYEEKLIDPALVPALSRVRIVCETHDFLVPGITESLLRRLMPSHEVRIIPAVARNPGDFPIAPPPWWLRIFGRFGLKWALSERRGGNMKWIVAYPKTSQNV